MNTTFNERGVTITRNGLSAGGQSFALREIEGLRVVTVHRNKIFPLAVAIAGAATAVAGGLLGAGAGLAIGVMLIVVGALAWHVQEVTHRLLIRTPAGEHEALSSHDLEFVERVGRVLQGALGQTQSV